MNPFEIQKKRIYKNTDLDTRDVERIKPFMESAFASDLARYNDRPEMKAEKLRFMSEQFANKRRISGVMGSTPMHEDGNIFGAAFPGVKSFFESADYSMPGNIIGMANPTPAQPGWQIPGGVNNPSYQKGTGDIPAYIFGLQSHLALNCQGFDLLPTIAVDTPKVVTQFVDTVYGGGEFDSIESLPTFMNFATSIFTKEWIRTQALVRGTTNIIFRSTSGKALKVTFILGSTVKAEISAEVKATGTSTEAAGTVTYTFDNSISVKSVIDDLNANGGHIFVGAGTTLTDGTVFASPAKVIIGYASATRTNISEAATNTNTIGGMTREQHRKGTKYKLNVIAMDASFEMVGIEIDADTENIQIRDFAAMGINVISYLYTGVQNQLVQTLDEIITKHIYGMGVTHAVNVYQSQGINYSLYLDKPTNTSLTFSSIDCIYTDNLGNDRKADMGSIENSLVSSTFENQDTHGGRLCSRIGLVSEFVGQQNRIGVPDIIVLGGELAAVVKRHSTYTINPITSTLNNTPELQYTGTVMGMQIFKNPKIAFNDPRVLLIRRGDDTDSGSKLLAYDLASSRQTIAEGTMSDKIRVWSRFQIADIGFYPELNYFVFVAINKFHWA